MLQVGWIMAALFDAGVECFCGMMVKPGRHWRKAFMRRLNRAEFPNEAKATVMVVLLSSGLYESDACLDELHTAFSCGIRVIPVRIEDPLPKPQQQWLKFETGNSTNPEKLAMLSSVRGQLNDLNSTPSPGSTLFGGPQPLDNLEALVRVIQFEERSQAAAAAATTQASASKGQPAAATGGTRSKVPASMHHDSRARGRAGSGVSVGAIETAPAELRLAFMEPHCMRGIVHRLDCSDIIHDLGTADVIDGGLGSGTSGLSKRVVIGRSNTSPAGEMSGTGVYPRGHGDTTAGTYASARPPTFARNATVEAVAS